MNSHLKDIVKKYSAHIMSVKYFLESFNSISSFFLFYLINVSFDYFIAYGLFLFFIENLFLVIKI